MSEVDSLSVGLSNSEVGTDYSGEVPPPHRAELELDISDIESDLKVADEVDDPADTVGVFDDDTMALALPSLNVDSFLLTVRVDALAAISVRWEMSPWHRSSKSFDALPKDPRMLQVTPLLIVAFC